MTDPDNIDWEREGCLGCKQRYCTGRIYRLDNGEPLETEVDLTHEDLEHARAELHLDGVPSHHVLPMFAWEERLADEHPGWYLALMVAYSAIIFALILGIAVIA